MLTACRMGKAEEPRVQSLPGKCGNFRTDVPGAGDGPSGAGAIGRVADKRMADMRQMYADLMGAAGEQPALDQRRVITEPPLDPVPGHRRLAARRRDHRHLLAVDRAA